MTASTRRRRAASGLLLGLSALVMSPDAATAQGGQPVQLVPFGSGSSALIIDAPRREVTGIQVNRLNAQSNEGVGVLEPAEGGFGPDLWSGMSRSQVLRALPELYSLPASRTLRELQRRLLLTAARAPVEQGIGQPESDLVTVRAERLWAMGELDGLSDLLKLVPRDAQSAWLTRTQAEVNLLRRDYPAACETVQSGVLLHPDEAFWQEAQAFCQLEAGNQDAALLSLDLLRETGARSDPEVKALIEAAAGYGEAPALTSITPLKLSLLGLTEAEVPLSLVEGSTPAVLAALAQTASLPLDTKVLVAEAAATLGIITGGHVAELYGAFEIADTELASVQSGSRPDPGTRGRALLYQAASRAGTPAVQAELTEAYLEAMEAAGAYSAGVRVAQPLLRQIPAGLQTLWYAEPFGRALFALGRFEQASLWFALANDQSAAVNLERDVLTALWPYAQLGGVGVPASRQEVDAWALRRGGAPDQVRQDADFLWALLTALEERGGELSIASAGNLVLGGSAEQSEDRRLVALDAASRSRNVGDTLLRIFAFVGDRSPGALTLGESSAVVRALGRIGLGYEARLFAIEAAAARGL